MENNENIKEICKNLMENKNFENLNFDYVAFSFQNSKVEDIQYSGLLNAEINKIQKELHMVKYNNPVFCKIIHQNRELSFNIEDMDHFAKNFSEIFAEKSKEIINIPQDKDSTIPNSENIIAQDSNIFTTDLSRNQIVEIITKEIQKYNKNFLVEIGITDKLKNSSQFVNSFGFNYEIDNLYTTVTLSLVFEQDGKKYTKYNGWKMNKDTNLKEKTQETVDSILLQIGAKPISGEFPCIIDKNIASYFISEILNSLEGENINCGNSFFKNMENQQIMYSSINIISKPHSEFGNFSYSSEGIQNKEFFAVESGVLKNFFMNSRYGRKFNKPVQISTSIFVEAQEDSKFDLGSFKDGFVITDVISGDLNAVTGDFKASITGYILENNRKIPVNNVVMSYSLHDLKEMKICNDKPDKESGFSCSSLFFPNIKIS